MKIANNAKRALSALLVLLVIVAQLPVSDAADTDVSVTWSLENITEPSVSTVSAGEGLQAALVAANNYVLPQSASVVGASGNTYEIQSGVLSIPAEDIQGDLTISAVALQESYQLDWSGLSNISVSPNKPETIQTVQGLSVTLTADEGYALPETITVEGAEYTYSQSEGSLTIAAYAVSSDVTVSAEAVENPNAVVWELTGLTASPVVTSLENGKSFETTLTPYTGYSLPQSVSVVGPANVTSYNSETGVLCIEATDFAKTITISASGIHVEHSIAVSEGCANYVVFDDHENGKAFYNDTVSFTVSSPDHYAIDKVSCQVGEETIQPQKTDEKYSFSMPDDNVTINVIWKLESATYTVKDKLGKILEATNDVYYGTSPIVITPNDPASRISLTEEAGSEESIEVSDEGEKTFYMSDGKTYIGPFQVVIDLTAPTAELKYGDSVIKQSGENTLVYIENAKFVITASDLKSGVDQQNSAYAIMKAEEYSEAVYQYAFQSELAPEEIEKIESSTAIQWEEYANEIDELSRYTDTDYVLVLRLKDAVGNVRYYRYTFRLLAEISFEDYLSVDTESQAFGINVVKDETTGRYYLIDTDNSLETISGGKAVIYQYRKPEFPILDLGTLFTPSILGVVFKRGSELIQAGAGFDVDSVWKSVPGMQYMYKAIALDLDKLNDGIYTIAAQNSFVDALLSRTLWSNTTDEITLILSRTTPEASLSYSGYQGYDYTLEDTQREYSTAQGAEDGAETGTESFASDKVLYVNGSQTASIQLGIEDFLYTSAVNINGLESVEGVTVAEDTVTVNGGEADDGRYTVTFDVNGYNGKNETITAASVVVDSTNPDASEIKAAGYTQEGETRIVSPDLIESGQWTNQSDIQLSIDSITDEGGLLVECITVPNGINGKQTITDGTWSGTISGEQNREYTITLTDKAGNITQKTFRAKIDTTPAEVRSVIASPASSDMAQISDVFSFGVFHKDYDKLAVTIEDPGEVENNISGMNEVYYYFVTSDSEEYHDLYHYGEDEYGNKLYYSQEQVKEDETIKEFVVGKIDKLLEDKLKPENLTSWKKCDLDIDKSDGNTVTVTTGEVKSDKQYVALFHATDIAGNETNFYRDIVITDATTPEVTFSIDENAEKVTLKDGKVIYTDVVPVTITVTEPEPDENPGAYSGVKNFSYKVFNGGEEPFAEGEFSYVPESISNSLPEQGQNQVTQTIYLEDRVNEAGKTVKIDSNNIYIEVTPEDISENSKVTRSDEQLGMITIDKTAPSVRVDFDGGQLNGRYYGADRNAVITVVDKNMDPATDLKIDTTGAVDAWTASEPDEFGEITYTANVTFFDGNHHFIVTEAKDKAEQVVNDSAVSYNVTDQRDFVVDTIEPVAAITFARVDGKAFGDYNNEDVTMTITVSERNFWINGVNLTVRKDGTVVGVNPNWTQNGDTHTGVFTFEPEGAYSIDLTVTDLANHSDRVDTEMFVLDKTDPTIEILEVENQHAYNDESITPVIRVTDTNYSDIGVDIDVTGVNGGFAFYDEANIAGGQEFTFENIEDDDIYILKVKAVDEAENESEMEIRFSVNRNGSVFTGDEEIAKAMENGIPYFRTETLPPIRVIETNVDIIEEAKLYLTRDNINIDIAEGKDYTVRRNDVNGGWSQYIYELNDELFLDDGVYRVSLVTTDAAGNAKNAEAVVAFIVDNTLPVLFVMDLASGAIYNEELKHVVFTPNDNLVLSRIQVVLNGEEISLWEGEDLQDMIRSGSEFAIDIPESNSLQTLSIILTDAAGNENENQLIENFLVSTNVFVRFYNNKPVFYSTIGGVVVLAAGLWAILTRRKKGAHTRA